MTRTTPLHDVHVDRGATMVDFAGWSMPVRYDSDLAEHHAVRQRAGLFDLSHMGEIEVTGPDAAAALDRAFVGNLSKVKVGRAKYSMLCAEDGGVLDDVIVYRRDDDRYLVVANAANADVVLAAVRDRAAGSNAEVVDAGPDTALIALQGPAAAGILAGLGVQGLDDLRYYAGSDVEVASRKVFLARTGYTGEDGFELFVAAEYAVELWQVLLDAGRDVEVVPCGLACRDTLRLEAGMPLYGNELGPDRTPFDAGMGRVIAFDTDFVGKEALQVVADAGPTDVLVGLTAEGRRAPRSGYPVQTTDGTAVGTVTSGALSPTLERPIAMAYVAKEHGEPGTRLEVDVRGRALPVEVVELPFYRRER
jgi:aminomethyltransferase